MGNYKQIDNAGLDMVVNNLRVGASTPGSVGTEFSGAEITVLDSVVAGTAAASKAVVLGASKEIATITTATITNLTSTTVTPTTIAGSVNFSGAPTFASTSTFTGSPTFNANILIGAGKTIDLDSATATLSSNAATITKYACKVTTESLSTAHTTSQALVITLVGVAAGDFAVVNMVGGTNTGGIPQAYALCTTDTVTVTLKNMAKATDAFNGTFIFNLIVFKA